MNAAQATAAVQAAHAALVKAVQVNGGATVDPATLQPVNLASGFVVGLTTGTALHVDPLAPGHELAGAVHVVAQAWRAALVGLWHDGTTVHVDPVQVVDDLATALHLGRERGQLAVFDLATGTTVDVPPVGVQL